MSISNVMLIVIALVIVILGLVLKVIYEQKKAELYKDCFQKLNNNYNELSKIADSILKSSKKVNEINAELLTELKQSNKEIEEFKKQQSVPAETGTYDSVVRGANDEEI